MSDLEEEQQVAQPVSLPPVTFGDRAKSFLIGAGALGGVTAFIGAGELSIAFAALGGTAAAVFSPELRGFALDRLPSPHGASTRHEKLAWFLTGQKPMQEATLEQEGEVDLPQDDMEELKPNPAHKQAAAQARTDTDDLPDDGALKEVIARVMGTTPAEPEVGQAGPNIAVPAIIGANPRRRIILAENFQPDADETIQTGVAAFGLPGSGKTTALVRMVEIYVQQFNMPFVCFDSQGDWLSLIDSGHCPRGVIATPETLPSMADVIRYGLQVVLDLSAWHDPGKVAMNKEWVGQTISGCMNDLMAVQAAIPAALRVTCLVILDEAHKWVPEGPVDYLTKETGLSLKSNVTDMANTGRKFGVVPFIAGIRMAQVDKDAIAGIGTRFFGKVDLDNDLKRYREYLPVKEVSDQQLRSLGKGDLIVSMNGQRVRAHFYNRTTEHTSHTPRVSQALERYAASLPPGLLAQVTRNVASPTTHAGYSPEPHTETLPVFTPRSSAQHTAPARHTAVQPATVAYRRTTSEGHRKRLLEVRRLPAQKLSSNAKGTDSSAADSPESVPAAPQPENDLAKDDQLVLAAYQSGIKTGNAIAAETGLSSTRVNQVLNKLSRRGLIDWQPRKA